MKTELGGNAVAAADWDGDVVTLSVSNPCDGGEASVSLSPEEADAFVEWWSRQPR